MKKLATFVFALLLTASLSFAQAAPATGTAPTQDTKTDTGKKAHKGGKKGHKGGKKGKKSDKGADTTATPK